jgi:hypothetical protein
MASLKKKLNSELRLIQAFFHPDLFHQIIQVNSLKDRSDHENGTNEKQTWSSVADLFNNTEPDCNLVEFDCSAVKDTNNHLINNPGYEDVDLMQFTETTDNGNGVKKCKTGLFKLRHEMKSLMTTVSGTHNNDPMALVNRAKKRVKNCSAHRLALYFFFVKCEEHPTIDDHFVPLFQSR